MSSHQLNALRVLRISDDLFQPLNQVEVSRFEPAPSGCPLVNNVVWRLMKTS